jgi:hypothetical protein
MPPGQLSSEPIDFAPWYFRCIASEMMKKQMRPSCVMVTDKLASYGAAKRESCPALSIANTGT